MTIPVSCSFGPQKGAPLDPSGKAFPEVTDRTKPAVNPQQESQICAIAARVAAVPPSPTGTDSKPVAPTQGGVPTPSGAKAPETPKNEPKTYYVRVVPHHPNIADVKMSPDKKQCLITVGEKEFSKFTPEEKAFILSHERGHCERETRPPQLKDNSPQAVQQALAQARQEELAADQLGRKIAAQAGFDPDKSKNFFTKLQKIEQTCDRDFFSFTNTYLFSFLEPDNNCGPVESLNDHPNASTRLNNYNKDLPALRDLYQKARTKITP